MAVSFFKFGKTVSEIQNALKEISWWHRMTQTSEQKRFKVAKLRFKIWNVQIACRHENVEKIRKVIHADGWRMIYDVCNILGLSHGTCRPIWNEHLNMMRTAATFVPRMLKNDKTDFMCARTCRIKPKKDRNFVSKVCLFPKMKRQLKGRSCKAGSAEQHHEPGVREMLAAVRRRLGLHWKGQ